MIEDFKEQNTYKTDDAKSTGLDLENARQIELNQQYAYWSRMNNLRSIRLQQQHIAVDPRWNLIVDQIYDKITHEDVYDDIKLKEDLFNNIEIVDL